jgi:hypothetical protein
LLLGVERLSHMADRMGEAVGLMDPVLPVNGSVTYPDAPGWGADRDFEKKRVAVL